ncbi:MAG: hypothetical protein HQ592_01840 [Planctomycetes bacterium]|nr:hypothetical protein [Planctomycetota bacterium]
MANDLPFHAKVEGRLTADGQVVMSVRATDRLRGPKDVLRVGEAAVRAEQGEGVSEVWASVYGHDMPVLGPALAVSYMEASSTDVITRFTDPAILTMWFGIAQSLPEA